jgi:3-oxoacyl-[acyl-carrier-protein] synthase III
MPDVTGRRVVIESLGVYLPDRVVTVAETLAACRTPVAFPIEELTGIHETRFVGDGEFSIDLAARAITDCFAHSRWGPADIDLLVCGNISRCDGAGFRYIFEPSTAIKLRERFGMHGALAFDITNACPGMFTAIRVVEAFIAAGSIRRGMVVSGDHITHLTKTAQLELDGLRDPRLACLTLGDSGAAVILEAAEAPGVGFHSLDLYTVGSLSDLCIAKVTEREHGGAVMYTHPGRLTGAAVAHGITHAAEAVRAHGWSADSVQHLIPHQTSRKTLTDMAKGVNALFGRAGWAERVTIDNLRERGNTATTSHFVAVRDHIRSGRIRSGDNVVFSIVGSGLTVGTALFTFDDLPDRLRRNGSSPPARRSTDAAAARQRGHRHLRGVRIRSVGTVPAAWRGERDSVTLAAAAAEQCLTRGHMDRSAVDVLLFAGIYHTGFVYEPAIAAMIAGALDLNARVEPRDRKTVAFDVLNGGLGFLNACQVATEMIASGGCETALVVASEVENNGRGCPARPRGVVETGAALLLTRTAGESAGFSDVVVSVHGEYLADFETYCAQRDGASFVQVEETGALDEHLFDCIPVAVDRLLALEGVDLTEVRWILPPQRSRAFISQLSRRMHLAPDRVVDVTRPEGDLFTSALPHALEHVLVGGLARPGDLALLIDVAAGVQVGCALYRL